MLKTNNAQNPTKTLCFLGPPGRDLRGAPAARCHAGASASPPHVHAPFPPPIVLLLAHHRADTSHRAEPTRTPRGPAAFAAAASAGPEDDDCSGCAGGARHAGALVGLTRACSRPIAPLIGPSSRGCGKSGTHITGVRVPRSGGAVRRAGDETSELDSRSCLPDGV